MGNFDLKQYLTELDKSESINTCPKVPRPTINEDQNYIFISYSHSDYKSVYAALAYMYDSGVRFWYDNGLTAGMDWETEAREKIQSPNCSGAIFFLSDNLFLSASVIKIELPCILGVDEKGEEQEGARLNYFCVNLTENNPSKIIANVLPELIARGQGTSWIRILATAFPDEVTYVSSLAGNYENALIEQIRNNFNVVDIAEDNDSEEPIYIGATKNGKYHGKGRLTYPKSDKRLFYEGDFVEGKREGMGILRYKSGAQYNGEWLNDDWHGKGRYDYSENSKWKYQEGDFVCGKCNGNGVLVFANGSEYRGEWKDGQYEGQGTFKFANGDIYEGGFKSSKYHGYGKFTYSESDTRDYYEGEFLDDKRDGKGKFVFKDGDFYVGEFKDGNFHGYGKYTYGEKSNADYCEGEWLNDKRNGPGVYVFKSGANYVGDFKNGKFHGKGKYIYAETDKREYYEGDWQDDKIHGNGVMKFKDGDIYEGEWAYGYYNGNGKYTYSPAKNQDYYIGEWKNDYKHGKGTLYFKNGRRYEGEWENGDYHGYGRFVFADGRLYEGEFKNSNYNGKGRFTYAPNDNNERREYYEGGFEEDKRTGQGVLKYKDGTVYTGGFASDELHGEGRTTNPDGSEFVGTFKFGNPENGKGRYYYHDKSSRVYYEGEFVNGDRVGYGVMLFTNGDKYEGFWENGAYGGNGKYTYVSPDSKYLSYEGGWKNSKYHGNGKLVFRDGTIYEGGFDENGFHGYGKYIFTEASNAEYYEGEYSQSKREGKGKLVYRDGAIYEGDWHNDKYHGKGRYTYPSTNPRDYDECEFFENYKNGYGVQCFKNGDVYEGEFKYDLYNGYGKYTFAIDATYESFEGVWANGKYKKGKLVYRNGAMYDCTWGEDGICGYGIAIWKSGFGRYWSKYEGYFKNGEFEGRGVLSIFHPDYPDMPKKAKEGIWSKGRYSRKLTKKARENGELDTPLTPPEE